MNPQERQQLALFLQQLAQAQAGKKDAEADALIVDACARQPNASYLLVQRAMLLEQALRQSQSQLGQVQAELEQARSGARSSFLDDANAWGRHAANAVAQAPAPAAQAPVMAPRAAAPPPAPGAVPSWGSGLLGNVATSAAGVVAGSFLFQGIESLMGHHHAAGAWGAGAGANPTRLEPIAEDTSINDRYAGNAPEDTGGAIDPADAGDDFGGSEDTA